MPHISRSVLISITCITCALTVSTFGFSPSSIGAHSGFIQSVTPKPGSVIHNSLIEVKFSVDMDPSTLNRRTVEITTAKYSDRYLQDSFDFTYTADRRTLTLRRSMHPKLVFGSGNEVFVTIRGSISDTKGNSMGRDFCWSFYTDPPVDLPPDKPD
jgi:hypothetical protein